MIPSSIPPQRASRGPTRDAGTERKSFFAACVDLTGPQRWRLALWCALLIVPSAWMYRVLTAQQHENVRIANETAAALLSTSVAMTGHTQPERTPPPGHEDDVAKVVKVGMYVNRIPEFSIVDSLWKVDFYIWFSWEGDEEGFAPGEDFKMATGEVLSRELLKKTDKGSSHYVLYRASAEISKKFDTDCSGRTVAVVIPRELSPRRVQTDSAKAGGTEVAAATPSVALGRMPGRT